MDESVVIKSEVPNDDNISQTSDVISKEQKKLLRKQWVREGGYKELRKKRRKKQQKKKRSFQKPPEKYDSNDLTEQLGLEFPIQVVRDDETLPSLSHRAKKLLSCAIEQLLYANEDEELQETIHCNILQQIHGHEYFVSTTKIGGQCLVQTFSKAKNVSLVRRFMEHYTKDLYVICVDLGATHVTQALLVFSLRMIQTRTELKLSQDDYAYFENWVTRIAEFCLENLEDFILHETNSTYVIRTLVLVLCGRSCEPDIIRNVKKFMQTQNLDRKSKWWNAIPESFVKLFNRFTKKIMTSDKLTEMVTSESSAPVVQILLLTLKGTKSKLNSRLSKKIANATFTTKPETDAISAVFHHENASFVVERMVEVASVETRLWLWRNHFEKQFAQMCANSRGNYIAQKIITTCNSREELTKIFDIMAPNFGEILEHRSFTVFSKVALMCKNLKCCQKEFTEAMMQLLQCHDPEERRNDIAPLIINMQNWELFHKRKVQQLIVVNAGAQIVQYMLQFKKPLKILKSLLSMPEKCLIQMARWNTSYPIYEAIFKCPFFIDEDEDRLITTLKPFLVSDLATKMHGSECLRLIWKNASIKSKRVIAQELSTSAEVLKSDTFGWPLYQEFDLHNYTSKHQDWEMAQSLLTKKRNYSSNNGCDLYQPPLKKIKKEIE